jgi:membrane associated rhomboid family serine protease
MGGQAGLGGESGGGTMGGLTIGMPKPGHVVKYLLILNAVVFVLQLFVDRPRQGWPYGMLSGNLGVTVAAWWQIWRYITFQFLHADVLHILLNMLGLYMIGTPIEQKYGPKKFLQFYLSCGVFAGLLYVVIGAIFPVEVGLHRPIIGASGGVFGILLAAAVYFPNFRLIFFLFPLPIRFACLIIFGLMTVNVLSGLVGNMGKAMSDVAHMGGALMAAAWIWLLPSISESADLFREKVEKGAWEKKMRARREKQKQIDEILEKIHNEGIQSLSAKEKRILQKASREQQKDEDKLHRL